MDFLNTKKNLLIVCPNSVRMRVLEYLTEHKMLCNVKFITKQELFDKLTFKISDDALYYIMNKYHYKISISRMYLENIKYALDKLVGVRKLDKLYDLKQELDKQDLLIYDNYIVEDLKNSKVIFLGYDYYDKFDMSCIELVKKYTEVSFETKKTHDKDIDVYQFDTAFNEIEFVANEISKAINNGVSLNSIKLCGVTPEYVSLINMVFNSYNIPVNGLIKTNLYSLELCQDFLKNIKESLEDSVNYLKDKYSDQTEFVNQIIDVCNDCVEYDNIEILKEILKEKLMSKYIKHDDYEEAVSITDLTSTSENDYVYLIGFNQNYVPPIIKDEDYISDDLCHLVLKDPTYVVNNYMKQAVIDDINALKNITITYRLRDNKATYTPSYLIDELGLKVKKGLLENNVNYSEQLSRLKLGRLLDDYNKYGDVDNQDLFRSLLNSLSIDDYMSYDNSYKTIDKNYFYKKINNSLTLSYTSLNSYQECPFKYFAKELLKADSFTESFSTLIGNIYHYVLQKGLLCDIDVDNLVWDYINNKSNLKLSFKEMFFVEKLTINLKFVLGEIRKSVDKIGLKKYLFEQKVSVSKKHELDVTFKGFVDKFILDEQSNIGAVIDYKTGTPKLDLRNTYYGLDLQLPIYLYLMRHKYRNIRFAGFYLQYILNKNLLTNDEDLEKQKKDSLKLVGYSNSDNKVLEKFDPGYKDSGLIKSMRINADGSFIHYAKTINDKQIDGLINLVDQHIDNTIEGIEKVDFKINPKNITGLYDSCQYCQFNDICYKKDKDVLRLEAVKDLSFLGGEIDA